MSTLREKIIDLYNEYGIDSSANKIIYDFFNSLQEEGILAEDTTLESYKSYCRKIRLFLEQKSLYDVDIEHENDVANVNTKLHRENQRLKDLRRVDIKVTRENERQDNLLLELNNSLISILEKTDLSKFTKLHDIKDHGVYEGLVHLTDLHLNSLVEASITLNNEYNFEVASKRLKLYAMHLKKIFKAYSIKNIMIAMTGDLISSDRRLDELLNQALPRMKGALLSCYLLEQFILDLNKDFNIRIASVSGNESRLSEEFGFTERVVNNNFDYMIFNILKIMFKNSKGITFIDGNGIEQVITIGNAKILLLHGDKLSHISLEKSVFQKVAKYAYLGDIIDYTLLGHIHNCSISGYFGRGASLAGGNEYADGLNLISKASQNCYIINTQSKEILGSMISLQDVKEIVGYNVRYELVDYIGT